LWKLFAAVRGGFSLLADHVWEWASVKIKYKDWA
jgi:hypothetical protein